MKAKPAQHLVCVSYISKIFLIHPVYLELDLYVLTGMTRKKGGKITGKELSTIIQSNITSPVTREGTILKRVS